MMINIEILPYLLLAYIIGSIPMGLLIARFAGLADPRTVGSGNIGATNMVRTGGKKWGIITLLLDALKGVAAVLICSALSDISNINEGYLFGLCAVIGHCYPVWLKFRGGKGVATALGVIAVTHLVLIPNGWWIIPLLAAIWIGVFHITHIVSIASLFTFTAAAIFNIIIYSIWIIPLLLTLLIFIRHIDNIKRLIRGTEHGFSTR